MDVPRTSSYYRFAETLLHEGVTAGCASGVYCAGSPTTREQMAAFVLLGREGAGYAPRALLAAQRVRGRPRRRASSATSSRSWRAAVSSPDAARGLYCPTSAVTREEMSVFVLRTLDSSLNPPACTTPVFTDVPASSPYCRWIEELARRGVVTGCGGGNYCPTAPVTREQMAVFVCVTFGLSLYGP